MNDMNQYCCGTRDRNIIEYDHTVFAYIQYYHIRARRCKNWYYMFSFAKVILVGMIPVLQAMSMIEKYPWVLAAFSSGILVLESAVELFKLKEKWRLYRNTCNQLMTVQRKYASGCWENINKEAKEYIEDVEAIINGEAGMWMEISKGKKEDKSSN